MLNFYQVLTKIIVYKVNPWLLEVKAVLVLALQECWDDKNSEDHTVFRYHNEEGLGDVSERERGIQYGVHHA